jgi:Arc/MetJ-type ribon-helix-helix transcriptional regulator
MLGVHREVDHYSVPNYTIIMRRRKEKVVFTAEPEQLAAMERVVREGRYESVSALLRDAINDKLYALRQERMAKQLEEYIDLGYADEDSGLIEAQAFDEEP